jgi:hypothetical protein
MEKNTAIVDLGEYHELLNKHKELQAQIATLKHEAEKYEHKVLFQKMNYDHNGVLEGQGEYFYNTFSKIEWIKKSTEEINSALDIKNQAVVLEQSYKEDAKHWEEKYNKVIKRGFWSRLFNLKGNK